jgi:bifunctional UDP-N-acetylglucosamine pyrophosphorylase/glucosamine-1-phosphate N-acetyltransferase
MSATKSGTTVVVLAAGKGTRMKSERPKVLHQLCGRSMLGWVLEAVLGLEPERIVLVVGHGAADVERAARAELAAVGREGCLHVVLQEPQLGTGHALQVAAPALGDAPRVVVTYGDMPLLRPESLTALVAAQVARGPEATALLTALVDDPFGYGRVVRDEQGGFERIVEQKDATSEERLIDEVNLGVYCFARGPLGDMTQGDLAALRNDNSQKEFYITDLAGIARKAGRPVAPVVLDDVEEAAGVNSLAQLAEARWVVQLRILERHLANGVQIEDPSTTYIDHGVEIGVGAEILPCTVIRAGVRIAAGAHVGPFVHLREGTVLMEGSKVGNFTEVKKSTLGPGAKANHLSYIGDATIGAKANIGAGTIFANYDGKAKHKSSVGAGAFVGSGSIIVAPNTVPAGATTGAGAVLTRSARMGEGETWVGLPARKLERRSSD